MAEFQEVMKQAKRMCKAHTCGDCPLRTMECECRMCFPPDEIGGQKELEAIQHIVMDWAKAHPEPRYPTWEEWHKANFPGARHDICPNYFMSNKPLGTCAVSCKKCANTPIPADVAEKLGIKPIEVKNDA